MVLPHGDGFPRAARALRAALGDGKHEGPVVSVIVFDRDRGASWRFSDNESDAGTRGDLGLRLRLRLWLRLRLRNL